MQLRLMPDRSAGRLFSDELIIVSIFMSELLNGYLSKLCEMLGIGYSTLIIHVIVLLLAIAAWLRSFLYKPLIPLAALMLSALVASCSMLFNPATAEYILDFGTGSLYGIAQGNFIAFFGFCISPLILSLSLPQKSFDTDRLCSILCGWSLLVASLFVLYTAIKLFGSYADKVSDNYMSLAYDALPAVFVLIYDFVSKRRLLSFAVAMLCVLCLGIGGCRGALLASLVFAGLWYIRDLRQLTVRKAMGLFVLCILLIFGIAYFREIITWVEAFLGKYNYSSRIIDKLLDASADGRLYEHSSRERIFRTVISETGVFGHGIYADRLLFSGTYAHNYVLELLYQFGYLLGGILVTATAVLCIRLYRAAKLRERFYLFAWSAFMTVLCIKLMLSSSYLVDRSFWFFLAIAAPALGEINITVRKH